VTRERLLVEVWGWPASDPGLHATGAGRTVDSHVRGLRAKIGGHRISTVHGVGYRLGAPPPDDTKPDDTKPDDTKPEDTEPGS